jgi:hypothetical protein
MNASDANSGDGGRSIWIRSEPDAEGIYHLLLEVGPDDVVPLDVPLAYRWAGDVMRAVVAAEYDAAVFRQLCDMGIPRVESGRLVFDLRAERSPSVRMSSLPQMTLMAGVSDRTGEPFLLLAWEGETIGQWTVDLAREHALAVIEAAEVAALDGAYARLLIGQCGFPRDDALMMITGLGSYRQAGPSQHW